MPRIAAAAVSSRDLDTHQFTRFNRVGVQWCAMNVYGRENTYGYEWDERRGVNVIEGLDEALPTIGLRFEYSWTPGE